MSMLTVLVTTIVIFAIVLFALSIGLIFGKRGLRTGCCGTGNTPAGVENKRQTPTCGACGPKRSDCDCQSDRLVQVNVTPDET